MRSMLQEIFMNKRNVKLVILEIIREASPSTVFARVCSMERPPSFNRSNVPSTMKHKIRGNFAGDRISEEQLCPSVA